MSKKRILLHCCCAPCSAAIIEWLMQNEWQPTLFYYNPNIYPFSEYEIRKNECTRYARSLGLEIIDGDYAHAAWLRAVAGLEAEPERGSRCLQCFKMRMNETSRMCQARGFEIFATTLASSRWKDLAQIAVAGNEAAALYPNLTFFDKNWRKDGLQERRNILLKENGFYNQQYCGCEFSFRHVSSKSNE
ncbi:MAG: epoxyqueuosine reductase QueH [Bacteroidales bacterium]|nr:epoxyqueuosine reductase QueH [Bacteroidales bacterium]MDD4394331.1 epoxyqueuosine reductase QueH [Bacteroidales bacterium]